MPEETRLASIMSVRMVSGQQAQYQSKTSFGLGHEANVNGPGALALGAHASGLPPPGVFSCVLSAGRALSAPQENYKKDQVVYKVGDDPEKFYIILTGGWQ